MMGRSDNKIWRRTVIIGSDVTTLVYSRGERGVGV